MMTSPPSGELQPDQNKKNTHSRLYASLLWLALIIIVLLIGFMQRQNSLNDSIKQTEISNESISPIFLIMGRYVYGIKIAGSTLKNTQAQFVFEKLILQMKDFAKSPAERICLTPMIAELIGVDAAIDYIGNLQQDPALSELAMQNISSLAGIYTDGPSSLTSLERNELLKNFDWFSELALSHGLPGDDPLRASVIEAATRTVKITVFFMSGGSLLALAGLILFIVYIIMVAQKRFRSAYFQMMEKHGGQSIFLLETMVIFLIFMVGLSILSSFLPRLIYWLISMSALFSILFWPRLRGLEMSQLKTALGWHRGKGIVKEVFSGVIGYLAGIPVIIVGLIISSQLIKVTGEYPVHPIAYEFKNMSGIQLVQLFIMACVFAPILEESLFRGVFYRYLRIKNSIVISACISGLVFAAIHPQGIAAIPVLGGIGAVFCLVREWRDSLIAPITAHALNNLIVTTMLFLMLKGG